MFRYDPRSMVEVIYVTLYQRFGHLCCFGLVIIWTIFFLCAVIYCALIHGIFVCALYYPIPVCDFAHFISVWCNRKWKLMCKRLQWPTRSCSFDFVIPLPVIAFFHAKIVFTWLVVPFVSVMSTHICVHHSHLYQQFYQRILTCSHLTLDLIYLNFLLLPNGIFCSLKNSSPLFVVHSIVIILALELPWNDFTAFLKDKASTSLVSVPSLILNILFFGI